ncbi:hypothetical protein D3C81_475860 [compost metagenome]
MRSALIPACRTMQYSTHDSTQNGYSARVYAEVSEELITEGYEDLLTGQPKGGREAR